MIKFRNYNLSSAFVKCLFATLALATAANSQIERKSVALPNDRAIAATIGNPARTQPATGASVPTGNGISYHGGPVMLTTKNVYYIYYGNWSGSAGAHAITVLQNLASNIGGSPYFNINTTYTDGSGNAITNTVNFAGSTTDNYSQGTSFGDTGVQQIVSSAITSGRLPKDPNGVYFVLTSADVNETSGFCSQYCGWHTSAQITGSDIKYAFVGNANRCLSACAAQTTSPNADPGVDGMASVIAHELEEAVTDPDLNAWFDSNGEENADKCAWTFSPTYTASNGSSANMNLGGYDYLIQRNWVNASGGYCALSFASSPVTLTSISPSSGVVGNAVPVTLIGTGFTPSATINVGGSGINISNTTFVSSTKLTATLTIAANGSLGAHAVSVTVAGSSSGTVNFTVLPLPPTLTSITPSSGAQGTSVPVSLAGTNFVAPVTLNVGSGVTASNVAVVSSTQITATFSISAAAAIGAVSVTVTAAGGVSSTVPFSVTAAVSFSPIRIDAGSSSPFTDALGQVWGADSNFVGGGPVNTPNPVNGTPMPLLYQTAHFGQISPALTYQFAVPNGSYIINLKFDENVATQTGQRVFNILVNGQNVVPNFDIFARAGAQFQAVDVAVPVAVTTGQISIQFASVVSNPRVSAIEILATAPPAPTLTALSPNSASAGASVPVTITGSNFDPDVVIKSGPSITATNVTFVSPTQLTATFVVAASATGSPNVTVSNSGGAATLPFTIGGSAPSITSITPASGAQGVSVPVTINGTNFVSGATVAVANPGVIVSNIVVASATQITATFAIAANATAGNTNVTVITAGGTSLPATFGITLAAPSITSITPSSGVRGVSVPVTINGTNFVSGATVAVANPGVTVSNVVVASAVQITATFAIASGASTGNTNVTVTTPGGTSLPATFGITLAAPSITSITPSSGVQGASVPITINGTNFVSGATVAVANPGVTVSNVVVASAVQITATFAIASGASTGNTNVTVTTSGGTSPAASFSVTAATAFTPVRIDAGSSTPYTDPLGQVWAGDSNFTGGGPVSNANPVSGTPVPALYQTAHYGPVSPALAYQFAVPNGSYIINLKFDENVFTQAGQRVFNILVNGQNVVPNFDIFARAGAQFQAVDVAIPVAVTTGQISIQFASVVSNPRVAAVEILPSALPAPTLTALSPNSASAGASVPVTITGSNFNTDVVINAGSNITVSNVTLVSATQMTATFTVAAGAAPGTRNVIVSTPGGTTPPLSFTVQ